MFEKETKRAAVSRIVSSLGMGCALVWFYVFCGWQPELLTGSSHEILLTAVIYFMVYGIVRFLVLLSLGLLGKRLETTFWRNAIFLTSLFSSLTLGLAVVLASTHVVSYNDACFVLAFLSGIAYGSTLCSWLQSSLPSSAREALLGVALALVFAGIATFLLLLFSPNGQTSLLPVSPVLPVLFSVLICSASIVNKGIFATPPAKQIRPTGSIWRGERGDDSNVSPGSLSLGSRMPQARSRSFAMMAYAIAIGFATTQFTFSVNAAPFVPLTVSVYAFLIVGTVFLFIVSVSRRVDVAMYFSVVGVFLCVMVFLSLILAEPSELLVIIASVLHWSCVALLIASSFETDFSGGVHLSRAASLLALFFLASISGSLVSIIVPDSRIICGIVAVLLLVFTLIYAKKIKQNSGDQDCNARAVSQRVSLVSIADQTNLTPRETEVFLLLVEGNSLKRIAEELYVSENTLKTHRTNIYQKMGVRSRQELLDKVKAEVGSSLATPAKNITQ